MAQTNKYFRDVCSDGLLTRALEDKPPRVVEIPALLWAIDHGHQNLIKLILSQPDFDPKDSRTLYALHYAAANNNPDLIDLLIGAGFDVNTVTTFTEGRYSAVHASTVNANPAGLERLIHHGADLTLEDCQGKTALERGVCASRYLVTRQDPVPPAPFHLPLNQHIDIRNSVENKVVQVLRILLDHGAHGAIGIVDDEGDTLLHHAVYGCTGLDYGHNVIVGSAVIRFLMAEGADMWATNNDGYSAIDQAICNQWSSRTALNAFIDLGLDVNYRDQNGDSILYNSLRCTEESYPLVELLLIRGASTDDIHFLEFFDEVEDPDPKIFVRFVRMLLHYGLRFEGDESDCFSFATFIGDLGVMDILYDFGADINLAALKEGMIVAKTPLQSAIEGQRVDILAYLLERDVIMTAEEKIKVGELLQREI